MGIVQSDILIREALLTGLREMKADTTLIDDMLGDLIDDELTNQKYGDKTIQQCKDWLTKTAIKVKLGLHVAQADLPCIAIALTSSPEAEATIGDVDFDNPVTVDPDDPTKQKSWRGVMANDSYTLACFVYGEPEYCLFLHSVLLFTVLRVKDKLLDERGFMCNSFTNGPFTRYGDTPTTENIFTRSITLNGKVRHTWPVRLDCINNSATILTDVETNLVPQPVVDGPPVLTVESDYNADWADLQNKDVLLGVK